MRQAQLASTAVSTLVGEASCQGPVPGLGGTGVTPSNYSNPPLSSGYARLNTPWALTYDYPSGSIYTLEASRIARIE